MVVATLLAVLLAFLVYRWVSASQPAEKGGALDEIAALEV